MTAHFCPYRGTWLNKMCPATCGAPFHELRHVGPERVIQLMNAVQMAWHAEFEQDTHRSLEVCIEWMDRTSSPPPLGANAVE